MQESEKDWIKKKREEEGGKQYISKTRFQLARI